MASIPLHVWCSRVGSIQRPDWSVIDLDPKGAPFASVAACAWAVGALCESIALPTYVKTGGSTGNGQATAPPWWPRPWRRWRQET